MTSSSVDGGKRHELDSLIMNLRKNLQTFDMPVDNATTAIKAPSVVANSVSASHDVSPPIVIESNPSKHHFYICWFMHKCLFTTEIFVFFIIILAMMRPSFLYYDEKISNERRRHMIRTRFSILYLILWSGFFTMLIHIMMFVQKKLALAYPLDP